MLDEKKSSAFAVAPVVLKEKVDLHSVYFFSDSQGWAGGDGVLYQTSDGGKSWVRVPIEIPPRAGVSHVSFINPSVGWVILQRSADGVLDYRENRFWLMRTTDGGGTWEMILEGGESSVAALAFTDEKTGWLAGIKYVGISPVRYTYMLLRTDDQGAHWTDASEPLKRLTAEQRKSAPDYINDGVMGLVPDGPVQATVVTGESKVLDTVNSGESWREIVHRLDDEMAVRRFGKGEDSRLFVAGGRSGHGTWGGVFIQQPDGSWVGHLLDGVFVSDVLFLPGNQLVACGFEEKSEKKGKMYELVKRGVVLHSNDGGKHWAVVYRSNQPHAFNGLATTGSGHVWAIGERGLFIQLYSSGK